MEFDNDISILYKEAQKLGMPTKFVKTDVAIVNSKEIKTYTNLLSQIKTRILAEVSLYDLYSQFLIDPKDLAMIYYSDKKDNKEILEEINKFYKSLDLSPKKEVNSSESAIIRLLTRTKIEKGKTARALAQSLFVSTYFASSLLLLLHFYAGS